MIEPSNSQIYPWQEHVWNTLTNRFPKMGHGLLFYGKKGCGKEAFTQHFLAWLLCLNKQPQAACGECSSCLWLKSDTHPNYVHITTDEENKKQNAKIKIEKIRDLQPFVQQTVEGWRVIVIEPAEALNIASSNALLKTLEEPGEGVTLILLAEHYLKLPATIRSRLQHFALDRITEEQTLDYIQKHLPDTSSNIDLNLLMRLSNDMPLQAIQLAESPWVQLRDSFMQDWLRLVSQKSMPMQFSSKWVKQLNFYDFMVMFEYLLADVVCYKLGQPTKNTDLDFSQIQMHYSLEKLFEINSDLLEYKKQVEQNIQTNLVLDQIFISLMNIH